MYERGLDFAFEGAHLIGIVIVITLFLKYVNFMQITILFYGQPCLFCMSVKLGPLY
jgi:hypothetical protein